MGKELNLSCPIFVHYVNVGSLSSEKSRTAIEAIAKKFSYDNATIWIVPTKDTPSRIEMIYNPIAKYSPFEVDSEDFEDIAG